MRSDASETRLFVDSVNGRWRVVRRSSPFEPSEDEFRGTPVRIVYYTLTHTAQAILAEP